MKRRFLALALALVMVVGLLPVLPVLTVSAVDEVEETYFDLAPAASNTYDSSIPNYYVASKDATPVKFAVSGNTATLDGRMNRESTNSTSLNYRYVFTSATRVDEHVTQTINIETMPVFSNPTYDGTTSANGYYNMLTRNYQTATAEPRPSNGPNVADCDDRIMYTIYNKDEYGNLGMRIIYLSGDTSQRKTIDVEKFAEKVGIPFTLTTVWHADNKVSFVCDGEILGTYDNVTFAHKRDGALRESLVIGYNAYNTATTGENPVKLTVSNVKISHAHNPAADDGDCTTAILCTSCGLATTAGKASHTFDHKVTADKYKKADGEYYYSCACGISSEGFAQETTFTVMDLFPATKNPFINDNTIPNYYIESLDTKKVKFGVSAAGDVATLSGSMAKKSVNLASLFYRDIFTNKTNEDVHLTQTINITTMPYFSDPGDNGGISAHGYYNLLSRQYGSATAPLSSTVANSGQQDRIMYSIYHKGDNNLGLRVYYYYYNATNNSTGWKKKDVPNFAEKVGEPFTLTTIWHADNNVTFLCDGETLSTFTDITFAFANNINYRDCLVIGYNANGTTAEANAKSDVNLTVSNVKISHGHTAAADDGNCMTAIKCSSCGVEMTPAQTAHTPGADDDDCTTDIICGNTGCTQVATAGAANHTPADDDDDCTTDILCSVCGKVATPGAANHTPATDDGDCTTAINCTVCGKETTPAAQNHTPATDDGDCTTAINCTVCGKETTAAKAAHTGGTATCEKKAECANCGKEYGELAAHTPGTEGDCLTGFTCTVCGDVTAAKEAHTPATDDGDCTTAINCTVCGKETTAAKEAHTPAEDDGDCTTAVKCSVCGTVTTAAKEAHTEKVVNAKPATETEKGYTGDKVCSVCGKELAKGEEIPVLEPAPTEPAPTEPAPTEPAPTTPPTTEPSTPDAPVVNPDTGDNGTAVYALLLAVSMMAMVVLMVPDIRNKLIRK